LPAPSLIGIPTDEAGYQALFRSYAKHLVTAALVARVDWQCCERELLFDALADWELSRLDLATWPVRGNDFARIAGEDVSLADISRFWNDRTQDRPQTQDSWQLYAFVDFLLARFPSVSVTELQRQLAESRSFESWLAALYSAEVTLPDGWRFMDAFDGDWQRYVFENLQATQEPPPIPLPNQDIVLTCYGSQDPEQASIARYQSRHGQWTTEDLDWGVVVIAIGLPGDSDIVISGLGAGESTWGAGIWDGSTTKRILEDHGMALSLGQVDPVGRYLVVLNGDDTMPGINLVELERCSEASCEPLRLPGYPVWSPDGEQVLMIDTESLGQDLLMLGDRVFLPSTVIRMDGGRLLRGNGQPPGLGGALVDVGPGSSPFWLDDTRYGYVRSTPPSSPSGGQELVVASSTDDVAHTLLALAAVKQAFANSEDASELTIRYAMSNPVDADSLLVAIGDASRNSLSILSLNVTSGELTMLLDAAIQLDGTIGLSPDGRWLVLSGYKVLDDVNNSSSGLTYLYDLILNEATRIATHDRDFLFASPYDWTADGEWLAVVRHEHTVHLIAPESGYSHFLTHPFDACVSVAWMYP
jgi:hypothetical protein